MGCLHQDIRTLGEVPASGNSFSDALLRLGNDVNVNIGGAGFCQRPEVGNTRPVTSRIQGHWERFLVQVITFSEMFPRLANDININIGG